MKLLLRYSTPLIIPISTVVTFSGVLMLFHLETSEMVLLHELFGLAFVLAAVLHVINYWNATRNHFSRRTSRGLILAIFLLAVVLYPAASHDAHDGTVHKDIIDRVISSPLTLTAPVLGLTAENAVEKLRASGIESASADSNINQMAKASGRHPSQLLDLLLAQSAGKTHGTSVANTDLAITHD